MEPMQTSQQMLKNLIGHTGFPCVGAKTAAAKKQIEVINARDLRCPTDDQRILAGVAAFTAKYNADLQLFRSLIVTFDGPVDLTELAFEQALWQRLQALHDLDDRAWDPAVSSDPSEPNFSYSLGGRAFYLIAMHPNASRPARRLAKPAIVFNLHDQFEQLRQDGSYKTMQNLVRRRDSAFAGSINPMLKDFGKRSEAVQYSGRMAAESWQCPFIARGVLRGAWSPGTAPA